MSDLKKRLANRRHATVVSAVIFPQFRVGQQKNTKFRMTASSADSKSGLPTTYACPEPEADINRIFNYWNAPV